MSVAAINAVQRRVAAIELQLGVRPPATTTTFAAAVDAATVATAAPSSALSSAPAMAAIATPLSAPLGVTRRTTPSPFATAMPPAASASGSAPPPAGTASGGATAYSATRTPAEEVSAFTSGDELTRGAAVARALHAAGFRGQDLLNMVGIAYRESGWTASSWVVDSDDHGGGLLGINQLPWLRQGLTPPYSAEDILDPYANARIARDMFTKAIPGPGGPYNPWKGYDEPERTFPDQARAAVAAAGLDPMAVVA